MTPEAARSLVDKCRRCGSSRVAWHIHQDAAGEVTKAAGNDGHECGAVYVLPMNRRTT